MGCRRAGFAIRRRPVTERYGVLLVNDETHSFSAGVGGANRGVLMTPFHNMALMCPVTTEADVAWHTELFAKAVDLLVGPAS